MWARANESILPPLRRDASRVRDWALANGHPELAEPLLLPAERRASDQFVDLTGRRHTTASAAMQDSVQHSFPRRDPDEPFGIISDTIRCMAMTLRLADDETEALRRRAELEHRSMQEVARQAIREYVENHSRAELLDQVLDEELPRYAEALERLGQ